MPRFSDIAKGTRATKTIEVPLVADAKIKVTIRPLSGLELGTVVAMARAYAISEIEKAMPRGQERQIPEPKEGDRLFDLGSMGAALLLSCLDPDDNATPFFADISEPLGLDVDRLSLLYEEQQTWQDTCAPRPKRLGVEQFMAIITAEAALGEDAADGPFSRLPRSMQRICFRTLAVQHLTSLSRRSPSGSDS